MQQKVVVVVVVVMKVENVAARSINHDAAFNSTREAPGCCINITSKSAEISF